MLQSNFEREDHTKGNKSVKADVVARLTVTRQNGWKTIVEISSDATLHSFYRYFRQYGNRRSTREPVRTAGRAEGCLSFLKHLQKPGLELILKRLEAWQGESNPIVSTKLRIIKKRAYRKLINARPDELGMVKSRVNIPEPAWRSERPIPVQTPALAPAASVFENAYQGEV